jgi:ABC-type uncharacterized transport system involved in gliding motility auxiliary subunit
MLPSISSIIDYLGSKYNISSEPKDNDAVNLSYSFQKKIEMLLQSITNTP